jgi:hypothetical protein
MATPAKPGVTYYAWSPIKVGDKKEFKVGQKITADDLEVSEEVFQSEYVAGGVARLYDYPKNVPPGKSAMQHIRDTEDLAQRTGTTGGTTLLTESEQLLVAQAAKG